jgi:hypothetical protein
MEGQSKVVIVLRNGARHYLGTSSLLPLFRNRRLASGEQSHQLT